MTIKSQNILANMYSLLSVGIENFPVMDKREKEWQAQPLGGCVCVELGPTFTDVKKANVYCIPGTNINHCGYFMSCNLPNHIVSQVLLLSYFMCE